MSLTRLFSAAAIIRSQSSSVKAMGFSTITCLPRSSAVDGMFGMKRIWRRNVYAVELFELAHCRDAVEGLNAKLGAVLFARCLSYICASDEGKSRRFRYRLR